MMCEGKRHGVGFTAFYYFFFLLLRQIVITAAATSSPQLSIQETIALSKHEVQQKQQNCVCGQLCCVDLVCMVISFYPVA